MGRKAAKKNKEPKEKKLVPRRPPGFESRNCAKHNGQKRKKKGGPTKKHKTCNRLGKRPLGRGCVRRPTCIAGALQPGNARRKRGILTRERLGTGGGARTSIIDVGGNLFKLERTVIRGEKTQGGGREKTGQINGRKRAVQRGEPGIRKCPPRDAARENIPPHDLCLRCFAEWENRLISSRMCGEKRKH